MSTQTCKFEFENEAKCSPHKFYEMIKYTLHHLPKVFPESYKSVEILEGDGKSVGSVRLWKYVLPGQYEVLSCKEKTKVVDDENMLMIFDLYEGDHINHYKCFFSNLASCSKRLGSLVKWTAEYEKGYDGAVDPHLYMDMFALVSKKLDAHVIAKA